MNQPFSSLSEFQDIHLQRARDLTELSYSRYSKPQSNFSLEKRKWLTETNSSDNNSSTNGLKSRTYAISNNFNCPIIESSGSPRSPSGKKPNKRRDTLLDITEFLAEVECVGKQKGDDECENHQFKDNNVSSCGLLVKSLCDRRGTSHDTIKCSTDKTHMGIVGKIFLGGICTNCRLTESNGSTWSTFDKGLDNRCDTVLNFTEFLADTECIGAETNDVDYINCQFTDSFRSTWSSFVKSPA